MVLIDSRPERGHTCWRFRATPCLASLWPSSLRRGGSMKKVLRFRVVSSAVFLLCVATAIASAQTFESLLSFDGSNGEGPTFGPLVQGPDGAFYGTSVQGGVGYGTVFKINSEGTLTTIYNFCSQTGCADGRYPETGLMFGTDGNFYGTTEVGGENNTCLEGCGTLFKLSPEGALTTLYNFCSQTSCADGYYPIGLLVQATDGNIYGTTQYGGGNVNCPGVFGPAGCGTIYKMTLGGTLTSLHSFDLTDGEAPFAGLRQANDGNLYSTTTLGGDLNCDPTLGCGTVYKITPDGTLTTLHNFGSTDGAYPHGVLVQAPDGSLYGITEIGGTYGLGTVFKITLEGMLSTLYSFCAKTNCTDGSEPLGGLVLATDGNLYGTTYEGGAYDTCVSTNGGCGTIFKITSRGILTTLHSFDSTDGAEAYAELLQSTGGTLYGTTYEGGTYNEGTVFSLSVGLGPFVETLPSYGKAGSKVIILGTGLTGVRSVTFNGTAATFINVSPTEIRTTVPVGATTGKVQVATAHGTLTSNVAFRVGP